MSGMWSFSAPKGIVFIATQSRMAKAMSLLTFQCPEGHCLHCYEAGIKTEPPTRMSGFSAPKGIVFIATLGRRDPGDEEVEFQCPEGHCLHCYPVVNVSVDTGALGFQCPEGHCLHCYVGGRNPGDQEVDRFSAPKGIVFIAT